MRVGIDIDGVLADMAGASPPAPACLLPADFWDSLDEIEPGMVRQLADTAAAERWDVFFLTKRPETGGLSAQAQTEQWLARHGFPNARVHIVRGSRGKAVRELELDLLIDDTLDNCVDTALQSKARSILIWTGDPANARRSLRGLKVDVVESFGDALQQLTARALDRTRRRLVDPRPVAGAAAQPDTPPAQSHHAVTAPTRRTFAIAAAVFAVFAIYGSLVPLEFQAITFQEALERFARVPYLQLGIQSRADFVANILLFIPLGFLAMGALRADRQDRAGAWLTATIVVIGACALANAIEFTQLFFPVRTVSQNDIFAETTGAIAGVVLWSLAGQRVTVFLRAFLGDRGRPALIVRLLTVYGAGLVVSQLLPLDIAISLGELSEKFHSGRILLVPFTYPYSSTLMMVWDAASDIALNAPIGALAVFGWTASNRRRTAAAALALGVAFVFAVEAAQLFIYSRYSDATDLLTGALGISIGVMLATRQSTRVSAPVAAQGFRLWPAVGAAAWACVIAAYHWYPFDFVVTGAMMDAQLPLLLAVPFRHYYFGSEFHAFTELSRKVMLAAPLGSLLWAALFTLAPSAARAKQIAISIAAALFFAALEAGQVFLPGRTPDLTDAIVGALGVAAGIWLVRLFERPQPVVDRYQESRAL